MTDVELREEIRAWEGRVENAGCFSSAYFAAQQLRNAIAAANRRGLNVINKHPIKVG